MMQNSRISPLLTALLIVAFFCPGSYAGQNENLLKAIQKSQLKQTQELLDKGADANATDRDGVTALMKAAQSGRMKMVQLLLNRGAQLSLRDRDGQTAVERAASQNNRDIVDLLSSRGADISLAVASMLGDTELVRSCLKKGADVNAKDVHGRTALIVATEHGHVEVVKLLLENHADINVIPSDGQTALAIAERKGFGDLAAILKKQEAKSKEALLMMKHADKVLRRGDELFFRLATGKIVSRRDTPEWEADTYYDPIGDVNVRYRFADFVEPWYVIDEGYMEGAGVQLLHRDSGTSVTVHGEGMFSPDRIYILAVRSIDELPCDAEIWKITDSGPIKEYVLEDSCYNSFRWTDASTVEELSYGSAGYEVFTRIKLNRATGKWSATQENLEKPRMRQVISGATDDLDEKALIRAADEGDLKSVRMLLKKGVNVTAKGNFDITALVAASQKGNVELVKLLLDKGAGINGPEKSKALASAARNGHKEIVELLVSRGAKLTLPVAAAIGDLETIQRLIQDGADVNAENEESKTAFLSAVHRNQWDAAIILLKNGAQIKDEFGLYEALLTAAAKDGHMGMIQTLLERETVAKEKLVPVLQMAAAEGKLDIVRLLLAKGADANAKGKYGRTALMAAAIKGQQDVAEALLAKGADVNASDLNGATALMDAAWGGSPKMIGLLVEKGADVNPRDADSRSAQQYAKLGRNEDIVKLLNAHGAKE